ncbi:hypothetical protein FVER53590_29271 [Fusarium verticillioides]|nr:hypothetical protein FVER53590_29271 [Fusarium verticillioides]
MQKRTAESGNLSTAGRAKNPSKNTYLSLQRGHFRAPSGQLKLHIQHLEIQLPSRPSHCIVTESITAPQGLRSFPFITSIAANMISDNDLYRLAIFFGTTAMILIVLYHFLEVNAAKDPIEAGKEGASKSL